MPEFYTLSNEYQPIRYVTMILLTPLRSAKLIKGACSTLLPLVTNIQGMVHCRSPSIRSATRPHMVAPSCPRLKDGVTTMTNQDADERTISQLDGTNYRTKPIPSTLRSQLQTQRSISTATQSNTRPPKGPAVNAALDLLPYCTTQTPLNKEQVVAISDIAGSLKELVMIALGAAEDGTMREVLDRAVGPEVAFGIMEFFYDDWVADT